MKKIALIFALALILAVPASAMTNIALGSGQWIEILTSNYGNPEQAPLPYYITNTQQAANVPSSFAGGGTAYAGASQIGNIKLTKPFPQYVYYTQIVQCPYITQTHFYIGTPQTGHYIPPGVSPQFVINGNSTTNLVPTYAAHFPGRVPLGTIWYPNGQGISVPPGQTYVTASLYRFVQFFPNGTYQIWWQAYIPPQTVTTPSGVTVTVTEEWQDPYLADEGEYDPDPL